MKPFHATTLFERVVLDVLSCYTKNYSNTEESLVTGIISLMIFVFSNVQ